MAEKNNKGGSVRLSDLIEYLEYKILHNEETEEDYALYTDIKWFGAKMAFMKEENIIHKKRLNKEMQYLE